MSRTMVIAAFECTNVPVAKAPLFMQSPTKRPNPENFSLPSGSEHVHIDSEP